MEAVKEFHQLNGGIPLDLILEDYMVIAKTFRCLYCQKLVFMPSCCSKCKEIFCISCYLKSNECLNCKISTSLTQPEISEKRLLSRIKEIKCINSNLGCKVIMNYDDIENHLDKSCKFSYKCKNCGNISDMNEGFSHHNKCKKETVFKTVKPRETKIQIKSNLETKTLSHKPYNLCEKCKKFLILGMSMEEHLDNFCEKNEFLCQYCKKKQISSNREAHLLLCPDYTIKCKDCSNVISKQKFPFHNEGNCFMKMLLFYENYRNFGNKFEQYDDIINEVNELKEIFKNEFEHQDSNVKREFLNIKTNRPNEKSDKGKSKIKINSSNIKNEPTAFSESNFKNLSVSSTNLIHPKKMGKIIIEDEF